MTSQPSPFTVRPATLSDIPSLTTIVPRSFHPTNAYIQTLFPDTPLLQNWWKEIFTSRINQPDPQTSPLLTISRSNDTPSTSKYGNNNPKPNENGNENATPNLGILSMHLFTPTERGAGFYTTSAPTRDHSASAYGDVERNLSRAREELMAGRAHFLIELFGVDHAFKGQGLGKQLLLRACEIADEAGVETFVMANASAQGIYRKVGFEERRRVVMEGVGEVGYEEFMLVRPVGGGGGGGGVL